MQVWRWVASRVRDSPTSPEEIRDGDRSAADQSDIDFRPKRAQFLELIDANGGRMKQSELVSETEWSPATVSRVVGEMESDGLVEKIPLGRTNVIARPGAQPNWYTPPATPTETGSPRQATGPGEGSPILLVEDMDREAQLLKRAFEEATVTNPIHTVRDGLDAVEFMLQRGQYADAPKPALVLLDLGLMMVDGFDVLEELDERQTVRGVPIIVLSQSDDPSDIRRSYTNGATAYLTKPGDLGGLIELVQAIDAFWLSDYFQPPGSTRARTETQRLPSQNE